jgi:hypothetical protein
MLAEKKMTETNENQDMIKIRPAQGEGLNGLAQMIFQYLSQNLAEFPEKRKKALTLKGEVTIQAEKGITMNIAFNGPEITITNEAGIKPLIHLTGPITVLAALLSGTKNPIIEIVRGNIKFKSFPRHPVKAFRILKFLKTPPDFIPLDAV